MPKPYLQEIMLLSLWQPWASLCVWTNPDDQKAEKQIETRHWSTDYRGLVAIHATKTLRPEAKREIDMNSHIQSALVRHGFKEYGGADGGIVGCLEFGVIVGVVELIEIKPLEFINEWLTEFSDREEYFGVYHPGRFGWVFKNHIELKNPIKCRGLQSLGSPNPTTKAELFEQLGGI